MDKAYSTLVVLSTENFKFENNGEARFKNTAEDSPCRLQTFVSNFSMIGMGYMIISTRNPIRFAYCRGSCHFPFSLDAGDDSYVTADMLIRHLAILKGLSLSDDEKDMFKTSYCVPVEYTSLRVVLGTEKGVRKKLWIRAIPRKCGCG